MVLVEKIVNVCVEFYKTIPHTLRPKDKEWTVVSAIVGVFNESEIKVLSLGTGSKCIGQSFMSPNGDILNDSHAEVIARRAFIKYLYFQIHSLLKNKLSEIFYQNGVQVALKDSVRFYFVTSMPPCGDASIMPKNNEIDGEIEKDKNIEDIKEFKTKIESLIKRKSLDCANTNNNNGKRFKSEGTLFLPKTEPKKEKKKDIHRTGAKCVKNSSIQDLHLPGVFYHTIGAVRTKPGRGDPTLSLSCSDKLARWNSVGWQGALLSLFINKPIFVEGIICGGGVPCCKESFDRAVFGRIGKKNIELIHQSKLSFPDLKKEDKKPSPLAVIWCRMPGAKFEISVNGYKQGATKKNFKKKSARTSICKKELFKLFESAVNLHPDKQKFLFETFLANKPLNEIKYGTLKSMAKDYQKKWEQVKCEYFKVWSNKPNNYLNFTLKEY